MRGVGERTERGDKKKGTAKGKTEAKVGGRRAGRRETGTCARIKAAARSDLELGELVSEEPDGPREREGRTRVQEP